MSWGPLLTCLLLGLQLALLPVRGNEVVLGRVGGTAELPCKALENLFFSWKLQSHEAYILGYKDKVHSMLLKGATRLKDRSNSPQSQWKTGSYPLVISKLEMEDTGTYICEVQAKKMAVDLLVFRVTANHNQLLPGQSLTLTLEGQTKENLKIQWKHPRSKTAEPGARTLSVAQVQPQHSGTWTCSISKDQKTLDFNIDIRVLGFQKVRDTVYAREGDQVSFSFPLNFDVKALIGKLSWQGWDASSPKPWVTFSWKETKMSVQESQDPKLEMGGTLPLNFTLPKALPHHAGTGTLNLTVDKGVLSQQVKLVVMRVTKSQHDVTCEVTRPDSLALTLSLMWKNQTKASNQETLVKVQNPEPGTWRCVLMDQGKPQLTSEVEVSSAAMKSSSMFLAMVLGAAVSFVLFTGISIFFCVRCWHRRRQAQRMSQIKRLLSERKTCTCPHRLQKTCGLV